jgi:hypothetical protein
MLSGPHCYWLVVLCAQPCRSRTPVVSRKLRGGIKATKTYSYAFRRHWFDRSLKTLSFSGMEALDVHSFIIVSVQWLRLVWLLLSRLPSKAQRFPCVDRFQRWTHSTRFISCECGAVSKAELKMKSWDRALVSNSSMPPGHRVRGEGSRYQLREVAIPVV